MGASALIPRLYRVAFRRDMVSDMRQLQKRLEKARNIKNDATEEEKRDAEFTALDLTIFENVAWLMLKHGGENVLSNPDEWLESLDGIFSVYEILPQILELWGMNQETTSVPVKK